MARKYTKKIMQEAVVKSTSWASLIENLGLKVAGGNYYQTKKRVAEYQIDTSHFTGQGWSKGYTSKTNARVASTTKKLRKWTDDELLSKNAPSWVNGARLRKLMFQYGVEEICAICCIEPFWKNKPLTLQVDHRNGNSNDNRLENLRFLCPNCHSQQATSKHNGAVQKVIKEIELRGYPFANLLGFDLFFMKPNGNLQKHRYEPGKGIPVDKFESIVVIQSPARLSMGGGPVTIEVSVAGQDGVRSTEISSG